MREYVASGKVYLIHRDFPLPNHAHARDAATYACASARINKYEEVCSALFSPPAGFLGGEWKKWKEPWLQFLSPPELNKVRGAGQGSQDRGGDRSGRRASARKSGLPRLLPWR